MTEFQFDYKTFHDDFSFLRFISGEFSRPYSLFRRLRGVPLSLSPSCATRKKTATKNYELSERETNRTLTRQRKLTFTVSSNFPIFLFFLQALTQSTASTHTCDSQLSDRQIHCYFQLLHAGQLSKSYKLRQATLNVAQHFSTTLTDRNAVSHNMLRTVGHSANCALFHTSTLAYWYCDSSHQYEHLQV